MDKTFPDIILEAVGANWLENS